MDKNNQKIEEYHTLLKNLRNQEKILLQYLIETNMSNNTISSIMMISRSRVYTCINDIVGTIRNNLRENK